MEKLVEVSREPSSSAVRVRAVDPADGRGRLLATFLKADLQSGAAVSREVLDRLDDVVAGRLPGWVRNGNSFRLTLEPDRALLEDQEADDGALDTATLPLAMLRQAVVDWLAALQQSQAGGA